MTKEERAAKWDAEFISCKKHPDRKCNRSSFIHSGHHRCGSCLNKVPSNARQNKLNMKRYKHSEKGKAAKSRYNHSEKGKIVTAWFYERRLHG